MAEKQNLSTDDILALFKQMQESSNANLIEAIKELKKPNELEQKKLDQEKERMRRESEIRVDQARRDEIFRTQEQSNCSHKKMDGSASWGGQVNSDGYVRFMCTQCRFLAPEVKAPDEWIRSGVNAQDPHNLVMKNLTLAQIVAWQKAFGGPKPKVKPVGIREAVAV
jgi:hypothetical protein